MRIANVAGRLVIVRGESAIDVAEASNGLFSSSPQAIYEEWAAFVDWADSLQAVELGHPFDPRESEAPVPCPRQVFAIGLNYKAHADEANEDAPTFPPTFTKFPTSLGPAYSEVDLPTATVDWEVELVVVIGRYASRVSVDEGWDYVAGVTVGQDLSERTMQLRPPVPQFSLAKSYPGFSPTGPCVVTPDELPNRDDLALECTVDGEVLQSGRTSQMIFSVPDLIAQLSSVSPLLPGDLIFTGTPSGVGVARDPQRFLCPGDVLITRIEHVGEMETRLRAGGESGAGAGHHRASETEGALS